MGVGGFLVFWGANGRGQNGKAVNRNSAELQHCKLLFFWGGLQNSKNCKSVIFLQFYCFTVFFFLKKL